MLNGGALLLSPKGVAMVDDDDVASGEDRRWVARRRSYVSRAF